MEVGNSIIIIILKKIKQQFLDYKLRPKAALKKTLLWYVRPHKREWLKTKQNIIIITFDINKQQ